MDIGSIVNWAQLAIWLGTGIIFFFRWMRTERVTLSDKIILGVLILVGILFSYYSLYRQYTVKAERLIEAWGVENRQCTARVNGPMLMAWEEKYDFVVVCGFRDPTRDELESTLIGVSPLFSIHARRIDVNFPVGKDMLEAGEKKKKATIWFRVALLPKRTDVANITRLSDIPRYGGVLLPLD
jgi:hypothetical protein